MSFAIKINQTALNQPTLALAASKSKTALAVPTLAKPTLQTRAVSTQLSSVNQPTWALQTLIQSLAQKPLQVLHGIQNVARNISDFSEAARAQRHEDIKVGKSLVAGAKDFSSNVTGFYEFLDKLEPKKLNREEIVPHLGGLAQEFIQKEAGTPILSAARELFPQTYQEISSIVGASTACTVASGSAAIGNQGLSAASGTLGVIGSKVLGWAGAAYSIYEIFKGKLDPSTAALSGATAGAYIGSAICPGVGTAIGAVVGGIGGFLSGMFKSGKPQDQKERDVIRKQLLAAGILDKDWNIALANGATFDMGKDGGARLLNVDGTERKYAEFDTSNPLSQPTAQIVAPLAQIMTGGNERLTQDFTAYLTNAAISNTDSIEGALQNLKTIYAKFGIPIEKVLQGLSRQ